MRVFYDCEFLEDGRTIDLISRSSRSSRPVSTTLSRTRVIMPCGHGS